MRFLSVFAICILVLFNLQEVNAQINKTSIIHDTTSYHDLRLTSQGSKGYYLTQTKDTIITSTDKRHKLIISRFNNCHELLWSKVFNRPINQIGADYSLTADSSGNLYILYTIYADKYQLEVSKFNSKGNLMKTIQVDHSATLPYYYFDMLKLQFLNNKLYLFYRQVIQTFDDKIFVGKISTDLNNSNIKSYWSGEDFDLFSGIHSSSNKSKILAYTDKPVLYLNSNIDYNCYAFYLSKSLKPEMVHSASVPANTILFGISDYTKHENGFIFSLSYFESLKRKASLSFSKSHLFNSFKVFHPRYTSRVFALNDDYLLLANTLNSNTNNNRLFKHEIIKLDKPYKRIRFPSNPNYPGYFTVLYKGIRVNNNFIGLTNRSISVDSFNIEVYNPHGKNPCFKTENFPSTPYKEVSVSWTPEPIPELIDSVGIIDVDPATLYNIPIEDSTLCVHYLNFKPLPNLSLFKGSKDSLDVGEFSPGSKWSTGQTTPAIEVDSSGIYSVYALNGSCPTYDSTFVALRDEMKQDFPDTFICPSDSLTLNPRIAFAENLNLRFAENDSNITFENQISLRDSGLYRVSYQDSVIHTFYIKYYNLPEADAGPDTMLCYNQEYEMQGEGGTKYKWTPANYLSNDTIPNPIARLPVKQAYILRVENQQACVDSAQVNLTVRPPLNLSGSSNLNLCLKQVDTLNLSLNGGLAAQHKLNWAYELANDSAIIIPEDLNAGMYPVILSDACSENDTFSLQINRIEKAKTEFAIIPDSLIQAGMNVRFEIIENTADYTYNWAIDSIALSANTNEYTFEDEGQKVITLKASHSLGCTYQESIKVTVLPAYIIFIPNAFSPDGDGINDTWEPNGLSLKGAEVKIFNRWGQLVYEGKGKEISWDGKGAPAGQYHYLFKAEDLTGAVHYEKGWIRLIR